MSEQVDQSNPDNLPKSISESIMKIGEHNIRVYQLDDGRRIIHADDVAMLLQAMLEALS